MIRLARRWISFARMTGARLAAGAMVAAVLMWGPAAHGGEKVDLELILMADSSGSIDEEEFILQRLGYANAFRNPRVANAIRSGPLGKIAVAYVEWTGPYLQVPIRDWMLIDNAASAEKFAQALENNPRQLFSGGTAIGHAILYAAQSMDGNGYAGNRRVIDISGDGPTNRGLPASIARDQVVSRGFIINGLPILHNYSGLDGYFRDNVIGGQGAFAIPAHSFRDFNSAILTKLIREIAALPETPGPRRARQAATAR